MFVRTPRTNDELLQRFEEWLFTRPEIALEPLSSQWEIIRVRNIRDGSPLVAYRRASGRESWNCELRTLFEQFCKAYKEP